MGFMRPDIQYGRWVEITHGHGSTTWVPADVCPPIWPDIPNHLVGDEVELVVDQDDVLEWVRETMPLKRRPLRKRLQVWRRKTFTIAMRVMEHGQSFKEFIEFGEVERLKIVTGWGARLSAPGYMDCTDWSLYDSEKEAHDELCDQYDLCEECGENLDADYNCPKCKQEATP